MTEKRLAKIQEQARNFSRIHDWVEKNRDSWNRFVFQCADDPMDTVIINDLLDEFIHLGFMELYYLLLWRMSDVMQIEGKNIKAFIRICLDKHIRNQLEKMNIRYSE